MKAWKGDKLGNLVFRGSANNFNQEMATGCKNTIAEVEEMVEVGELDPAQIHVPAVHIKGLVQGEAFKKRIEFRTVRKGDEVKVPQLKPHRTRIVKRAAKELKDGMFVNLGIGMPTLCSLFLDENTKIIMQSENGILGMGPYPLEGKEDADFINAGKETVELIKGASLFSSAKSFDMIRGGHIDLSILGGMQVSKAGDLAN